MKYRSASVLFALLLVLSSVVAAQESAALSLKSRIALQNVNGPIDHLSVDVKGERLFVAAVSNHTLEVIDLRIGRQVRTIADLAEPPWPL
jgi:uncharacterized ParB-like nuclease family protein